jgi:hypothetical protein
MTRETMPVPVALRAILAALAALEIYFFSDIFSLGLETLADPEARWFDILSALAGAVVAPLMALLAAALALAGRRLGLAAILLVAAPVVYFAPAIAFAVGIVIYGF